LINVNIIYLTTFVEGMFYKLLLGFRKWHFTTK